MRRPRARPSHSGRGGETASKGKVAAGRGGCSMKIGWVETRNSVTMDGVGGWEKERGVHGWGVFVCRVCLSCFPIQKGWMIDKNGWCNLKLYEVSGLRTKEYRKLPYTVLGHQTI